MRIVVALLLVLSVISCGAPRISKGDVVPAFSLVDQNPNSKRAGEPIGPTAYSGVITGWYFLHTT